MMSSIDEVCGAASAGFASTGGTTFGAGACATAAPIVARVANPTTDASARARFASPRWGERARCLHGLRNIFKRRLSLRGLWLRAMIGMAGQDRRRPINLLHQHDPHQLMGPGRRAEREHSLHLAPQFRRKSVRPADHKYNVR